MINSKTAFSTLLLFFVTFIIARCQDMGEVIALEGDNIPSSWLSEFNIKGPRKIYSGAELKTIGMPCGGIASGQLYVRGDGTLAGWWIANNAYNTGYGIENLLNFNTALGPWKVCYQTFEPFSYIEQGFTIVTHKKGQVLSRPLNNRGFNNIQFIGEYPVAEIIYRDSLNPLSVDVSLEVFSPFIPLNSKESALPATIMQFSLRNTTDEEHYVELQGCQQNMVMLDARNYIRGYSRNRMIRNPGVLSLYMDFVTGEGKPAKHTVNEVFDDFESGSYKKWKVEGSAFGTSPVNNNLGDIKSGFQGEWKIHSGYPDPRATGILISEEFKIEKTFLSFLLSGFERMDRVNISLVVNGKEVEKTSGDGVGRVQRVNWDVSDYRNKIARIEIRDNSSTPGHYIAADDFILSDSPVYIEADMRSHTNNGNMSLSLIDQEGIVIPDLKGGNARKDLGDPLTGGVNCSLYLKPGETKKITYLLTWYFPNRPARLNGNNWNKPVSDDGPKIGNMYANWFSSSIDVARYVHEHLSRLTDETFRFRNAYYSETTLPYWLSQRIMMPVSTLATETCQWWATGKFYAWEGVGSCVGTCTHVWNYEHALARLFPDLEMNIREMTDFSTSFREDGGIYTRNGGGNVHIDGQAGTILKSYREHLVSDNLLFLSRNWEKIKKATVYLINQDGNFDGLIESQQRNTYDISFMGANTYVGGLYLASLRAAEKMAMVINDKMFADSCRMIHTSGSRLSSSKLWNGEYFIQDVDLNKYPRNQYADGCLSDQLFGQTWAHQLKLGYIYPEYQVKKALSSIWKYNWKMDVGIYNKEYLPERYFAREGESGLINCTWPLSQHPRENAVRYRDEVWTGIEYQVASNMIHEGMIPEGLSIVRAVHERYKPEKHNPWNEIECGDHYARALASWGVLIALEDYFYDGNRGFLSYSPKIQADNFNGFFTASRGWGNIIQRRGAKNQENIICVKWGELTLKELNLNVDFNPTKVKLSVNGHPWPCQFEEKTGNLTVSFEEICLSQGNEMIFHIL